MLAPTTTHDLLCLIRGLNLFPLTYPIERWEDLHDPKHMVSSIGDGPLNWLRLSEVDIVIRPWVVRRACVEKVGPLDEAFCPIEWDEADFAYRIREAGFKVATQSDLTHFGAPNLTVLNLGPLSDIESVAAGMIAAVGVAVLGAFMVLERRREFAILPDPGLASSGSR